MEFKKSGNRVIMENNVATVNGRYRIRSSVGTFRLERILFEDSKLERDWKTDA